MWESCGTACGCAEAAPYVKPPAPPEPDAELLLPELELDSPPLVPSVGASAPNTGLNEKDSTRQKIAVQATHLSKILTFPRDTITFSSLPRNKGFAENIPTA